MKAKNPFALLFAFVLAIAPPEHLADQAAVVTEDNLNVRGKPSFSGEVITQLLKGETVVVVEDITLAKTQPGEPASWSRIQMPANTPVWIFAPFVDPNSNTINVSRLNVRAGPGENFSIVGRLDRGQTIKQIRTVDDWMEIETPSVATAFVASQFLSIQETAPKAPQEAPATPEVTDETPSDPPTESTAPTPPDGGKAEAEQPTTVGEPLEQTTVLENDIIRPAPALEPTEAAPIAPLAPIFPEEQPVPDPAPPPPTRRIVRREGIVRLTRSIQAPTYFELVSADTGKAINYLKSTKEDFDLTSYKGKSIIVTGEEGIEARWPKQPVLLIETLRLVP